MCRLMPYCSCASDDNMFYCIISGWRQQNKALCGSWAPHRAERTECNGVINHHVENVKQQSKHVLVLKRLFPIFAHQRALSRPAWSAGFLQHTGPQLVLEIKPTEQALTKPSDGRIFVLTVLNQDVLVLLLNVLYVHRHMHNVSVHSIWLLLLLLLLLLFVVCLFVCCVFIVVFNIFL